MTRDEYRAALKALRLTQHGAAPALGISPRMSQSYALGEWPVPEPIAKLLKLMLERKSPHGLRRNDRSGKV